MFRITVPKLETWGVPKPAKPRTETNFDFEKDREGWGGLHSMSLPSVRNGIRRSKILGGDPYFTRGLLRIPPGKYSKIIVRMKLPNAKRAQFFWQIAAEPAFRDDKYLNFPTAGDGQFHEYEIPVGNHAKWRGQQIRAIRLDPAIDSATIGRPSISISYEVSRIRLHRLRGAWGGRLPSSQECRPFDIVFMSNRACEHFELQLRVGNRKGVGLFDNAAVEQADSPRERPEEECR